jgi:hypothetical protein
VIAIGSKVTVIQNTFSLYMNQTSSKDSVNTTAIQGSANDKITVRMLENTSTLLTGSVRLKALGLEIKENVSIPRIRCVDEEKSFVRERISRFDIFIGMGEISNKLHKHQGLFGFGLRKFKIEFMKDDDPFRVFSPEHLTCQDMVHGV